MKSEKKTILLLLVIFLGYLGIHRFYSGKIKSGIFYLLTAGLFGIGWIVDIVLIATNKFTVTDATNKAQNTMQMTSGNNGNVRQRISSTSSITREELSPHQEMVRKNNIHSAPTKKAVTQHGQRIQEMPYRVIHSKVAGVSKKNEDGEKIQSILADLNDACDLKLVREPDNSYDTNAIKVYAHGDHIGYINADLAKDLAKKMDNGIAVDASIDEITGGGDGFHYGCNIIIRIQ